MSGTRKSLHLTAKNWNRRIARMKNILLVCSAGMSTSMLVKKMQEAAVKMDTEVGIKAIPEAEASSNMDWADIVLLGPQVRFLQGQIQTIAGTKPVEVIDMASYGTMNGEKVLLEALDKIKGEE